MHTKCVSPGLPAIIASWRFSRLPSPAEDVCKQLRSQGRIFARESGPNQSLVGALAAIVAGGIVLADEKAGAAIGR